MAKRLHLVVLSVGTCIGGFFPALSAAPPEIRKVKVVTLPDVPPRYFPVLEGSSGGTSMESGVVTLEPGKAVGAHNTKHFEELVVTLSGTGELRQPGKPPIPLRPGVLVYSPPNTEHDVFNTGTAPLRYVFIAAKAR